MVYLAAKVRAFLASAPLSKSFSFFYRLVRILTPSYGKRPQAPIPSTSLSVTVWALRRLI
ncbi:hypothetical protein Alg215_11511 [Pyrenophora tritici-repentis]|nr:hypothetical protein Alg215_11511 [Pyrenophora tritici-repentis]